MLRDSIIKTACLLMLFGFTTGIITQVELMKTGTSFMSQSVWSLLLFLHVWATTIALVAILLCTISFIRHRATFGQWAVWLGFCTVPVLFGILLHFIYISAQAEDSYLEHTTFLTAYRHAYGMTVLLAAIGGLSALKKMKCPNLSFKTSFGFAFLITTSGITMTALQAGLGLNGLPRRYIDYPYAFAHLQLYSSIAAIGCFSFSTIYIILLWRLSDEKIEEVF